MASALGTGSPKLFLRPRRWPGGPWWPGVSLHCNSRSSTDHLGNPPATWVDSSRTPGRRAPLHSQPAGGSGSLPRCLCGKLGEQTEAPGGPQAPHGGRSVCKQEGVPGPPAHTPGGRAVCAAEPAQGRAEAPEETGGRRTGRSPRQLGLPLPGRTGPAGPLASARTPLAWTPGAAGGPDGRMEAKASRPARR